jgi:hypothetical protein
MKIQYTEYVAHPALRGTITHLPRHRAQPLIDIGAAVEIPYADFRERLREEEAAKSAAAPTAPAVVSWAVTQGMTTGRYAIRAQCSVKTVNLDGKSAPQCSTLYYEGTPTGVESLIFLHSCGCVHPEKVPAAIAEQYKKLQRPIFSYSTKDEALAAQLGAKQESKPVDLSKIVGPRPGQPLAVGYDNYADFAQTPLLIPEPLKVQRRN